jgi:signal transduction histidine kinase
MVWMVGRSVATLPGGSSWNFARLVAADVGSKLDVDRQLDLQAYVERQYAHMPHPFFVLMTDGRLVTTTAKPETPLLQFMRNELRRRVERKVLAEPARPLVGRASIIAGGELVGLVAVPPRAPLLVVIGRFAPKLTLSGLAVLMAGTLMAARLIVRSPRRRLSPLQQVTERVASDDLQARAPEDGRDEVTVLARAFNTMTAELGARADQLHTADQARRQLLADTCHELSTPLTAIQGFVEMLLLQEESFDSSERRHYLQIIAQEARRMRGRIEDLLDLARLEAGGGFLTIRPTSVRNLLDDVVATFNGDCARKQITLRAVAEQRAETVLGDPDRLEQVLQNLTANAIRHTPPGGRIELRASSRGTSIHITVSDTGVGILPEHLPRVFDRFYRGNSDPADRSGSGLGLSIAKAITERHGGAISVRSRAGETVFDVALPLPGSEQMAAIHHWPTEDLSIQDQSGTQAPDSAAAS